MRSIFRGAPVFDNLSPGLRMLIISTVVVYLFQIIIPGHLLEQYLALRPFGQGFWPWQVMTYAFLHGNGFHLFINMFILWMFAGHIEQSMGTRKFIAYYFLCASGAALTHLLIVPGEAAVGASGAIYGLLLAFGLLYPDAVIYLFFVFPMRAIQAVFFIGLLAFAMSLGSGGSRIAHVAHLGGMLTGLLYFKLPVWFENFRLKRFQRMLNQPKTSSAKENLQEEVDRILEKISSRGVESLTSSEHETMQRYARKKK